METAANQIELDLVVVAVTLPNRLDIDDSNVVVLHGYSESLLCVVQVHAENLLSLGRRWLPSRDEVISFLTRGRLVLFLADIHGHLAFVGADEETF